MARSASRFKQRDVTRAWKAIAATGAKPHVWISPDGTIHAREDDLTQEPPKVSANDSEAVQACDDAFG